MANRRRTKYAMLTLLDLYFADLPPDAANLSETVYSEVEYSEKPNWETVWERRSIQNFFYNAMSDTSFSEYVLLENPKARKVNALEGGDVVFLLHWGYLGESYWFGYDNTNWTISNQLAVHFRAESNH